ncbi:bile acid:sodium symporter family protein [Vibrio astriarenae]|uniref:bile acid:sodium symporter family protein n=1 Tax=Vibrio agarivorans TaxID=153622 RepID=UPI0025B5B019|nr:bile acid:sodium symporter family protein [Vibrio agarivorans]MDN3663395.1 bile acid:sodium symporter family protein [Vibrio agarivorans]
MDIINKLKQQWFILGMIAAILLSLFSSPVGASGGWLHLDIITSLGIALVFLLHGLNLSRKDIAAGMTNWKLHGFIQATTFVVYPLLWLLFGNVMLAYMPAALAIGFCYLFVLPSTISSSVAMTSIAKGNVPGAIFNASLSSILGVFITPLLVFLFVGVEGESGDAIATILSVAKLLVLPMVIGQLLRPVLKSWLEQNKQIINKIDKLVIIAIVYNVFCDSVESNIWSQFSLSLLLTSVLLCSVILLLMVHLVQFTAKKVNFARKDEIAAVFCGTKKTLAAGVPMAKVIFASDPSLGMILLPIMLYHPIQIFYCAVLAERYAKNRI